MKKSKLLLIVSIILMLVGSVLGNSVQTNFGKVTIKEVKFTGPFGNTIEGYLYIPKGTTKDNPAPAVINIHGYLNTKEVQTGFSIEYARRGYVVLAIDMPGHGYSDPVPGGLTGFFTGGPSAFAYLSNLDIVQKDKIALEGHSMGGWNCVNASELYGDKINTVVLVGSSSGTFGLKNYGPETPFNFAMVFGKADEFVALNWEIPDARAINNSAKMKANFGVAENVVPGKVYGSFENKTARGLFQVNNSHAGEHMSKEAIGAAVGFVQNAMPASNPLPESNQIWPVHEFSKFLNLIGIALFILFFGAALLETRYFETLKQKMPMGIEGKQSKVVWGIFAIIGAAVPALTYFQSYGVTFLEASFMDGKVWRPQGLTYSMEIWALLNSAIMLVLFVIWHFAFAKKAGATFTTYGLSTNAEKNELNWGYLGKTGLLAVTILGTVEAIAIFVGTVFKIDFRYWIIGFKALNFSHFKIMLIYIVPFFIFYLVSGLAMQSYLRLKASQDEKVSVLKSYLVTILINGVGMLVLVAINYGGAWTTGVATFANYTLECIVAIQFMILLPFSGVIANFFYRKTGTIYLGAMMNAIFITGYIVVSQAVHYFPA